MARLGIVVSLSSRSSRSSLLVLLRGTWADPLTTQVREMKKLVRIFLLPLVFLSLLFLPLTVQAQLGPVDGATATPIPGTGHDYLQDMAETVNPADGSLSVRIKTPTPSGRGIAVPFSINYDSNGVHEPQDDLEGGVDWASNTRYTSSAGWIYGMPRLDVTAIIEHVTVNGKPSECLVLTSYSFQDSQGTRHSINAATVPSFAPACSDNGYQTTNQGGDDQIQAYQTTNDGLLYLSDADGTTYTFQPGVCGAGNNAILGGLPNSIEDRNGNLLTFSWNCSTGAFTVQDTLSRTAISAAGFGPTQNNTVSISGENGTYGLGWGTAQTDIAMVENKFVGSGSGCNGFINNGALSETDNVVKTISLPDGQSFSFGYDSTFGLLDSITYPAGNSVAYTWEQNPNSAYIVVYSEAPYLALTCGYQYATFAVASRKVYNASKTLVLEQDFTYSPTTWNSEESAWAINGKQTTVKTTDWVTGQIFSTVYTYSPLSLRLPPYVYNEPEPQLPLESTILHQDGSGNTLSTETKTWQDQFELLTDQVTLGPAASGVTSGTKYSYGPGAQVTEKWDYDFGTSGGGQGSLLRNTVTKYQAFGITPIFTNATSIFDRPCQTIVYNGSGTRQAETDYYYDNDTNTTTPCSAAGTASVSSAGGSSLTGHDETHYSATSTPVPPRGNLTTSVEQCFSGSTACTLGNPTSTYTYDETGQRLSMTDPNGNLTTYLFSDNYLSTNTGTFTTTAGSPPSGKVTNAYVTKITYPKTGTNHIVSFTYGYNDGELTTATDQNSQVTTYRYNDDLDRITETDYPDQGQTTLSYSDAGPSPSVTTTKLIATGVNEVIIATSDGMGHTVETTLSSDPDGATYTVANYAGIGKPYQVYNPTRCSTPTTNCGETTWGITTYTYDGLGRTTKVAEPDGSSVSTSYSGNQTTVTDEAGNQRTSQTDGLGRLQYVWEAPNNTGYNYQTVYAYDALSDLLSVNQNGSRARTFTYDSLSRLLCAANPEVQIVTCPASGTTFPAGAITYTYDLNGNLLNKMAPMPNQPGATTDTTSYSYDALNRLTGKGYSDGTTPTAYFQYDTSENWGSPPFPQNYIIGRLTGSWVSSGGSASLAAEIFSYDKMGRVLVNPQCTPSTCGNSSFMVYDTYDLAGNLTSTTTAAGTVISYGPYNAANRLTTVTSSLNDAQHPPTLYSVDPSVGYWPAGEMRKASFGNGLGETLAYNSRLQPCRVNVNSTSGYFSHCTDAVPSGNLLDFTIGYNAGTADNGNVASWSAVGNQTFSRSYGYDPLNRIQSMSDSASGQACQGMSWTIDAWGNMTNQTGTKGTCYNFSSAVGTNNQLQSGYQYDAAGNMTYDGTHHYTYDAENRITQVDSGSTASYVYDANGRRVRKSTGSGFTEYSYGLNGSVQGEYNGSSWPAQYVYAGSELIVEYENSTTEFVHTDHLGSTRLVTAVNQTVSDNLDYLPFGQQVAGASATTHKFTGKERDTESNLDNFGARYNASSLGRFMTPDWSAKPQGVPYAVLGDPQSLNLYAYVRNNPLNRTDPTGHCDSGGQKQSFLWCVGHALGFNETKEEAAARISNERQWLVNNVAQNKGQADYLRNASATTVNGIYRKWDSAIQGAQNGEVRYPTQDFTRDASGNLVLYRGGPSFEPRPGEYKLNPDGTVKTTRGVSVNTDPTAVERFGGAYEIKMMPPELTANPWGRAGHYELVPAEEGFTMEQVLQFLRSIVTEPPPE